MLRILSNSQAIILIPLVITPRSLYNTAFNSNSIRGIRNWRSSADDRGQKHTYKYSIELLPSLVEFRFVAIAKSLWLYYCFTLQFIYTFFTPSHYSVLRSSNELEICAENYFSFYIILSQNLVNCPHHE